MSKAKQRSLTEKATINWTQIKIDWDEYIKNGAPENWRTEFTPVIRGVMEDTAEGWNAEMGIQFDVRNLFVPEVLEDEEQFFKQWFDEYMDVFSENILDTTRTDLAKLLEQADANGWTVDEMRRQLGLNFERYTTEGFSVEDMRLTDKEKAWFMERLPRYRKENIARTETMKAANAGSFELFKAWEVVELKEWLSTNDNRTRDTHIRAGAQYVEGGNPGPIPLDQPFIVGGQQMMYPLDGSLGASVGEIAQCRCSVAPVVFEEEVEIPDTARPLSTDETEIPKTLDELRPLIDAAIKAGDPTGGGMKELFDTLKTELDKERSKNAALWENFGKTKDEATPSDWLALADILEKEGYELYKKYTKEGISVDIAERRGATDAGYAMVGGQHVMVKRGQFSRRTAQRMVGELWGEAKEEMIEAEGSLLMDAGFTKQEIAKADYWQRLKLLEELGKKDVSRTQRGYSKIDAVPPEARLRVTEDIDFDMAATAEFSATDPLMLPDLDAYGKMELADELRSLHTIDESEGETWPEDEWSDADDWGEVEEQETDTDWLDNF